MEIMSWNLFSTNWDYVLHQDTTADCSVTVMWLWHLLRCSRTCWTKLGHLWYPVVRPMHLAVIASSFALQCFFLYSSIFIIIYHYDNHRVEFVFRHLDDGAQVGLGELPSSFGYTVGDKALRKLEQSDNDWNSPCNANWSNMFPINVLFLVEL